MLLTGVFTRVEFSTIVTFTPTMLSSWLAPLLTPGPLKTAGERLGEKMDSFVSPKATLAMSATGPPTLSDSTHSFN